MTLPSQEGYGLAWLKGGFRIVEALRFLYTINLLPWHTFFQSRFPGGRAYMEESSEQP